MEKQYLQFGIALKGVDDQRKSLRAVFSTTDVDRHGDIVLQNWDLQKFLINPVILNSHSYHDATEVIGRAVNVGVVNGALEGDIEFAVDQNPKAKTIYELYKGGFLNAFSVGFIPLDFDEEGRISKAELLEVSAVAVPSNAFALAKAKGIDVENAGLEVKATDFPKKGDDKKITLRNSEYPQFDYDYATSLKEEYPNIWDEGGNIRGNEAFVLWGRAREGSETDGVLDWIKEREAWAARHEKNSEVAGVVAQIKWGVIGSRGESYMKELINEEKKKEKSVQKSPACRLEGESTQDCMSRKIPEIIGEGYDQEQAIAIAASQCESACGETEAKAGAVLSKKNRTRIEKAIADLKSVLEESEPPKPKSFRTKADRLRGLAKQLGESKGRNSAEEADRAKQVLNKTSRILLKIKKDI